MDAFSDFIPYDPSHFIYDIEVYPNVFTCTFKNVSTGIYKRFEISQRKNDLVDFLIFIDGLNKNNCMMIGFNNIGYDYPVIHDIGLNSTYTSIYIKSKSIIETPWENRFLNNVWESEHIVKQMDLYKIHHFDNVNRATSLKMLEFNMRRDNISDLPFSPCTNLTFEQIDELIEYNDEDVDNTEAFYFHTLEAIVFRAQMGDEYRNYNDTKIGKKYFEYQLPDGLCRIGSQPRQTVRPYIELKDAVLPWIKFERLEFESISHYLKYQIITETKGVFKDLSATVDGFTYVFGVGGIHGSVESQIVCTTDTHTIYDWDVKSYYPNISIANNLHPEHLGNEFCHVYNDLYQERSKHPKGSVINAALKLALNGVYGDSNNPYSPFYDPLYTMSITINGQLLLCMLAEQLIKIPNLRMIQINTDGLTVLCPNDFINHMNSVCEWWEETTHMELEHVIYNRMFIRDVNNYIAETDTGKLKSKGAYVHTGMDWNQDHSGVIVAKAAEAYLVYGTLVHTFIHNHNDIHDFTYCTKVKRKDRLEYNGDEVQRICRYIVTTRNGGKLIKISPPSEGYKVGQWKRKNGLSDHYYNSVLDSLDGNVNLDSIGKPWDERINTKNRSIFKNRETKIFKDRMVTICNDIRDAKFEDIDYDHYIKETMKLITPLLNGE